MSVTVLQKKYEINKVNKRLRHLVGQAIADFQMITENDKVMVCLSGGKDSYVLLDILWQLRAKAPIHFDIIAVNLDQRHPGFPEHILPEYLQARGIPFHILQQDTYSVVKRVIPEGKTMCGLCSRLRRGALYSFAKQNGITRIALGHHRDDRIETLFLNMFYHAKIASMPPKLLSDDGAHVVIRPLAYCEENDIAAYAEAKNFPIIPCNLCGSQETLQRQVIKNMLQEWQRLYPGRIENLSKSMQDIRLSQLADRELFDFSVLGGNSREPLSTQQWLSSSDSCLMDE